MAGSKPASESRSSIQKWRTTASTSARFRQGWDRPGRGHEGVATLEERLPVIASEGRSGTDSIRQKPSFGRRGRGRRSPFTKSERKGPWDRTIARHVGGPERHPPQAFDTPPVDRDGPAQRGRVARRRSPGDRSGVLRREDERLGEPVPPAVEAHFDRGGKGPRPAALPQEVAGTLRRGERPVGEPRVGLGQPPRPEIVARGRDVEDEGLPGCVRTEGVRCGREQGRGETRGHGDADRSRPGAPGGTPAAVGHGDSPLQATRWQTTEPAQPPARRPLAVEVAALGKAFPEQLEVRDAEAGAVPHLRVDGVVEAGDEVGVGLAHGDLNDTPERRRRRRGRSRRWSAWRRANVPPAPARSARAAPLGDAAVLEDHHLVEGLERDEPVRDQQRGAALAGAHDLPHHLALGERVEVRGRLVEEQEGCVPQQRAGEGEALPLAPRELLALLADPRVEPVRQARHQVVESDRGQDGAGAPARRRRGRRGARFSRSVPVKRCARWAAKAIAPRTRSEGQARASPPSRRRLPGGTSQKRSSRWTRVDLPGAARAHDRDAAARLEAEAHAVEREAGLAGVGEAQVAHLEESAGTPLGPGPAGSTTAGGWSRRPRRAGAPTRARRPSPSRPRAGPPPPRTRRGSAASRRRGGRRRGVPRGRTGSRGRERRPRSGRRRGPRARRRARRRGRGAAARPRPGGSPPPPPPRGRPRARRPGASACPWTPSTSRAASSPRSDARRRPGARPQPPGEPGEGRAAHREARRRPPPPAARRRAAARGPRGRRARPRRGWGRRPARRGVSRAATSSITRPRRSPLRWPARRAGARGTRAR